MKVLFTRIFNYVVNVVTAVPLISLIPVMYIIIKITGTSYKKKKK